MPRLVVPLKHRILNATGDVLIWAEIKLLFKDQFGGWHRQRFLVDCGAEMTTMPANMAQKMRLPLPQRAVVNAVHTQTGQGFRSGLLRARVVGMDSTEYGIPCFFLGDPAGPSPSKQSAALSRCLLGLSGVLSQIRITFDGQPGPRAPYGNIILEKV